MLGNYLIATTKVIRFMAAVHRMKVPKGLAIALSITLRYFPAMKEEWTLIREAMALRGISGSLPGILFASSYAVFPKILVLDEPSSNLDNQSILELAALLKRAKQAGMTVLTVEHRIWYLTDIVDRVLFMRKGRIERDLSAKEFGEIIAALLEELSEQNKLIFVITHDLELIERVCSRLLCLQDGKIVQDRERKDFGKFYGGLKDER